MRLFIAINLAEAVRRQLWEATTRLRAAEPAVKWVGVDGLHLTVKFLGEVDGAREPAIAGALDAALAGHRAFALDVDGCGAFPSLERPSVVWAGCARTSPLELVYHDVEAACERLGFPLEARAFQPHVTLGRVRRGKHVADLAGRLDGISVQASDRVETVDLMQSMLGPEGPQYAVRHRTQLETD